MQPNDFFQVLNIWQAMAPSPSFLNVVLNGLNQVTSKDYSP
jgi:hypothetical protein